MNRLTYKELMSGYYPNEDILDTDCFDKLGQLEDLEESIGCPLEVVTSKTAMVVKDNQVYELEILSVEFNNGNINFGSYWSFATRKLKDYGKTWWLKGDKVE
ncbi:MAG: hypothetical protein J6R47_06580 [Acholeplasmatales bacterium]|nr:hypothetical protein [Acholeplasmatales bacterium]